MPLLSHEDAIEQYFQEVRDKYPEINYERFREICRSPFIYIKKLIMGNTLPIILVKHLGKFVPTVSRVKKQIEVDRIFFEKGIMEEEEYNRRKLYLENYLKDYYNEPGTDLEDDTEES